MGPHPQRRFAFEEGKGTTREQNEWAKSHLERKANYDAYKHRAGQTRCGER